MDAATPVTADPGGLVESENSLKPEAALPGMLTVRMTAEILNVSPSLVYALCAAGKIRYERHGVGRGVIRIPPDALDEYRSTAVGKPKARPLSLRHLTLN